MDRLAFSLVDLKLKKIYSKFDWQIVLLKFSRFTDFRHQPSTQLSKKYPEFHLWDYSFLFLWKWLASSEIICKLALTVKQQQNSNFHSIHFPGEKCQLWNGLLFKLQSPARNSTHRTAWIDLESQWDTTHCLIFAY